MIKEGNILKFKEGKVRPSVFPDYQQKLLCDFLLRKDQENYGMIPKEVVEGIIFLNQPLTINKSCNHYNKILSEK